MAEDETLSELAESIKEFGIVTPIITRPKEDGNGYEVIAGQRRVRASELAGINTVPAFVLPLDRDRVSGKHQGIWHCHADNHTPERGRERL